jgi:hypothetical protein
MLIEPRVCRWVLRLAAAGLLCAGSVPAKAATLEFPGVELEWRHYRSPNFELYSTQSQRESRELLHNLELLRAVLFQQLKVVERTRLDVTVFAFSRLEHFTAYLPPVLAGGGVAAFYAAAPDRAIICMGPGPSQQGSARPTFFTYTTPARHIIFHEYIHHLFRATDQQPTLWFNEGFSELLATIEVRRRQLEIGHPNGARLLLLQNQKMLPWAAIFGARTVNSLPRDHAQSGMFYAQSWAFLHYLYFAETKPPPEQVDRFMRAMADARAAAPADPERVFRECFGYDFEELRRRMEQYVAKGKYRYGTQPLPAVGAESTYASRRVSPGERHLRLAELAVRMQHSAMAKLVLLEAQSHSPAEPRVHEVLGSLALAEGDARGAAEHWQSAIDLGTQNPATARELTLLECRGLLARFDFDFRLPPEKAQQMRDRLLASIKQEPAQSTAYEMLALVEALSDEPCTANVNLVQAHFKQLSEKQRTVVALAMVRVRLGDIAEAEEILAQLRQLPPDPVAMKIADEIRARLLVPTGRRSPPSTG